MDMNKERERSAAPSEKLFAENVTDAGKSVEYQVVG